ncbi:site-specific integrase [Shewanella khirikhana]|uniref:site-specific integrase n=1 Tax=Shewanella khirikhana TaxID=1965282 RepID=UPI0030CF386F
MEILQGSVSGDGGALQEQPVWIVAQRFRAELRVRFKRYLELGQTLLTNSMLPPDTVTALKRIKPDSLSDLSQIPNSEKFHINRFVADVRSDDQAQFESQCVQETAQMLSRLALRYAEIGEKLDRYEMDAGDAEPFEQDKLIDYVHAVDVIGQLKSIAVNSRQPEKIRAKTVKYKLRETFETFIAEKRRQTKSSTGSQYQTSFTFFFSVLGEDFDVLKIDKKVAIKIKEEVLKLKTNARKGCDRQLLSVKTANRYLLNFSTFIKWAVTHCGYEGANPFQGLMLQEKTGDRNKRRRFTDDEVWLMLGYQTRDKREATGLDNCVRWYAAIGAYSGMRLNEISQLRLSDVRVTDGIHYFDLTDAHLKTESSQRLVPIHSKLIASGFLEYIEERRSARDVYLFQELYNKAQINERYGPGEPMGKWFNRTLLRNIGINKSDELNAGYLVDFHCLRKTVISIWKHKGAAAYIVRQLVGHHRGDDITFDSCYGEGVQTSLSVLQSVIELIDYGTPASIGQK